MANKEMSKILGRAMITQLSKTGFDFSDPLEAMAFIDGELGNPVNLTYYFQQPCNDTLMLSDCINPPKVNALFSEVMGAYMRNHLTILLPILFVIAAISLVTNALGIRAVIGIRHKLPRHWVLMNLSIADSLLAPFNAIKVTAEVLAHFEKHSAFDVYYRNYFNSAWQVVFLLCPVSLFFLALDNFVGIVAPFFYERHSGSGARVIMLSVNAATWFCIILFVGLLHAFKVQHSQTVQVVVAIVLLMIIAITVTVYLVLAMKAEIYRRKLLGIALPSSMSSNAHQQRELLRSRMKTTATTLSIVLTLAGFWSPFTSYLLLSEKTKFANFSFFIKFLCIALTLFQMATAIDPIVYCCRMAEARRSLIAVMPSACRRCFKKKQPSAKPFDNTVMLKNGTSKNNQNNFSTQNKTTPGENNAKDRKNNGPDETVPLAGSADS